VEVPPEEEALSGGTRRTKDNDLNVKAAADTLQQALDRSPTIPELADHDAFILAARPLTAA
jgi:hypothetical protein